MIDAIPAWIGWLPWLLPGGLLAGYLFVYWMPKTPGWLAVYGAALAAAIYLS